jgi:hypothetical protein
MATPTNNFWTAAPTQDPKRGFRFRVQIGGIGEGFVWYAKKSDKPQVSFTEASHSYLNHTYYWPARTEWNEVSITFVDPVSPDLAGTMGSLLQRAGYRIPETPANPADMASMSKTKGVSTLGVVLIEQIDENGAAIETWSLHNAWVKEVTFGELDYGNDDLTEMTMKFRYDWASLTPRGGSTPLFAGPNR